jgi:mannose-6-phosphate isomerase-like protein (cupin superfamily)
MDPLSREILKELLPAEKDVAPRAAVARAGVRNPLGPLDHWSAAVLLERAAYLRKLARQGDGAASETLKEYPRHCAMLLFRSRDGVAEAHENFADIFYVLDGRATLVTGGALAGAASVGPGEMRGSSVEGGARQELRAGDVAHVPAGVPHQMLVAGEQTLTCLVLKVEQNP